MIGTLINEQWWSNFSRVQVLLKQDCEMDEWQWAKNEDNKCVHYFESKKFEVTSDPENSSEIVWVFAKEVNKFISYWERDHSWSNRYLG